jgi:xanthine dehydrogenase large subunit
LDNAYYIPNLRFEGRVAKTNLLSNTAFRGFGGPQGVVVIEEILNRAAEHIQKDPADVRALNFYGPTPRNYTPYGQEVIQDRSLRIFKELTESASYYQRRKEIDEWNQNHQWVKRGIGYQPVKFGISFTNSVLNQAGALVLVYSDGSVQLNHGGTEMGQGLHTKMLAICAHTLGVHVDQIRMMNTATDKVPNTSATAASSGSDLNGQAVAQASEIIRERIRPVAADLLKCPPDQAHRLEFIDGLIIDPLTSTHIEFKEGVGEAYIRQISLSSTGFYRTPNIHYDRQKGQGKPFHYYSYGGAILEVEVNGLTGEYRVIKTDILHDVGKSLVPSIDIGQVEGGFIQGLGWLTREELCVSDQGVFTTHSPDTYKVPSLGDAPLHFNVDLLSKADQHNVIHGSKAVGEPPFLLAIGILSALRHSIASFSNQNQVNALPIPCTPEAVLASIEVARGRLTADQALSRYKG